MPWFLHALTQLDKPSLVELIRTRPYDEWIFCMAKMTQEFTANLEDAKKAEMGATLMVEGLKHMKRSGYTTYWAEESERHKAQKNSRMLAKSALRDAIPLMRSLILQRKKFEFLLMLAKAACFETRCVMEVSTQDGFPDLNEQQIEDLRQACEMYDQAEMVNPWDESPDFDLTEESSSDDDDDDEEANEMVN